MLTEEEKRLRKRLFIEAYRRTKTIGGALRDIYAKHQKVIHRSTVEGWLKNDKQLAEQVKEMDQAVADELIERLLALAKQGDRQAAMTLLQRYAPGEFQEVEPVIEVVTRVPRPVQWARTRPITQDASGEAGKDAEEDGDDSL